MKKSIFYIAIALITFSSCTEDNQTTEIPQNVIVEGFLYANQPISNLKLMSIIPYYDSLDNQNTITDANVTIEVDGNSFSMTSLGNGYYELPNIVVEEGKTYAINLEYYDKTVEAETVIPTTLTGLMISDTLVELTRATTSGPPTGNGNVNQPPLEISWDDDGISYYFVHIQNMETEIDWINTNRIPEEESLFSFSSEPELTDLFSLNVGRQLTQFGQHRVIIYKVNPEYALMLSEQSDASFSLTEPYTNITNGRGIFTGISSDTLYFDVEPL
ncbi:MAG: DUF4249 family protein [Saprospiraceae bacterium]